MAGQRGGIRWWVIDLAATTAALFAIFEPQEFDGLERLLAPGVKIKQNGNPEHGLEGLMAFVQGLTNDGVSVVLRFDDSGLITRIGEYVDSAVFASLYT